MVNTAANQLLDRLTEVGGSAWIWRGRLRLRPLNVIPEELALELHANGPAVIAAIAKRPKRLRDKVHTPEKRFIAKTRNELLRNIEGTPTKAQKVLVDRIAWLSWHVKVFDDKAMEAGGLSAHASREYLAYSNALERCTRHLIELRGMTTDKSKSSKREPDWADNQVVHR